MSTSVHPLTPSETPQSLLQQHRAQICDLLSRVDWSKITQEKLDSWTNRVSDHICAGRTIKFTSDFLRLLRAEVADAVNPATSSTAPAIPTPTHSQDYDPKIWVTIKFNRSDWVGAERQVKYYANRLKNGYRYDVLD